MLFANFCVFFMPQETFTKYLAFSKHSFRASQLLSFYPCLSPSVLMGGLSPAFPLLLCQSSETTPLRISKEFSPICKTTPSPYTEFPFFTAPKESSLLPLYFPAPSQHSQPIFLPLCCPLNPFRNKSIKIFIKLSSFAVKYLQL